VRNNLTNLLHTVTLGCVLFMSLLIGPQASAQLPSGSILSIDATAGTAAHGQLFVITQTGQRTILSDFGAVSQGTSGIEPNAVAWLPATLLGPGAGILVTDGSGGTGGNGAVFKVDPQTGARTVLSDFGNATSGTLGSYPIGVLTLGGLLDSFPTIYVIDAYAGTNGLGILFQVDGRTGYRTVISDFNDSSKGALGAYPNSIAWNPGLLGLLGLSGNTIIIADGAAGTMQYGAVFSVTTDGNRTLLSDFGNSAQGPVDSNPLSYPVSVAVAPIWSSQAGSIFVLDAQAGPAKKGVLVKISANGRRTVVSDFGDASKGPLAAGLEYGALVWQTGQDAILVQDGNAGTNSQGALFSVNPTTGVRTLLSDFGNASSGSTGSLPAGLGLVP
jgi:hypothetical protein